VSDLLPNRSRRVKAAHPASHSKGTRARKSNKPSEATNGSGESGEVEPGSTVPESNLSNIAATDGWLARVPTLAAYAAEVGAEEKHGSFRRLVIQEPAGGGYWRELATISIDEKGEVKCWGTVKPPTDQQRKAIADEFAKVDFPKSIDAFLRHAQTFAASLNGKPFTFKDETGEKVKFIEQRILRKDGEKQCIYWSFWSDGKWRMMKPDGLLPLYGLEHVKKGGPLMIHEGPKAAEYVQRLKSDPDLEDELLAHPLGAELRRYNHLGWASGAHNVHGTDWGPLKRSSSRKVLICDNDGPGILAATKISRILGCRLAAVRFDNNDFPAAFDLAEKWPAHEKWWKGKRYVGPRLEDLAVPATWATDKIKTGERGQPANRMRSGFGDEWIAVTSPSVFASRSRPHVLLDLDEFNSVVRPFSDAKDTASLLRAYLPSQVSHVDYLPAEEPGVVVYDGVRVLNTFRPSDIRPYKGKEYDPEPFLDFMRHLIPDDGDRHKVLRWCATLIARPGVRMRYSVLLISETQGVGKGTLADAILAPLVGRWNCSTPDEDEMNSQFNSWAAHKRLAIVNEIYADRNPRIYDKLKTYISDDTIKANEKFLKSYTMRNYLHMVACSNSMNALRVAMGDRRWLIPRVTEQTRDPAEWRKLQAWIAADGLEIIRRWADDYVEEYEPVATEDHAPSTNAKVEVIVENLTDGCRLAHDLARIVLQRKEKTIVAAFDVHEWVAQHRGLSLGDKPLEKKHTLRRALRDAGLKEGPHRYNITVPGSGRDESKKYLTEVLANFDINPALEWPELSEHFKRVKEIWPL
jgi:hypothetical protein